MADDDKTERATGKRRGQLRQKGDIARSKEVTTAVLFGFALLAMTMAGEFMLDRLTRIAYFSFGMIGHYEGSILETQTVILKIVVAFLEMMAPLFLAVIAAAIVGNAMQGSLMWTMKPLEPKWGKLNPFSGFKSLFNLKDRSVDLLKSLFILVLLCWVCYLTIRPDVEKMPILVDVPVAGYLLFDMDLAFRLMKNVLILYAVIALVDYLIQRHRYEERNKMTKQEVKDEFRQQEGDPKVKSRIRRLQIETMRRRMMAQVPKADVVITNPTHFAVALRYEPDNMVAPQVVAKGADLMAKRIIEIAEENRVTVYRDPPVARALYKAVEPGDYIPADMFKAVAEILAQVYKLNSKAAAKIRPSSAST